jgi:hypothetical protein
MPFNRKWQEARTLRWAGTGKWPGAWGVRVSNAKCLQFKGCHDRLFCFRAQEIVSLLKKRLRTDNPQKQWLGILLFQKVSCRCFSMRWHWLLPR